MADIEEERKRVRARAARLTKVLDRFIEEGDLDALAEIDNVRAELEEMKQQLAHLRELNRFKPDQEH